MRCLGALLPSTPLRLASLPSNLMRFSDASLRQSSTSCWWASCSNARGAYQRQCAGGRAKARAAAVVAAQGWVRGAWPTGHLVIRTCSAFPLRSALALSSPCFSCFFLISPAWMVEYCGEQAGAAGRGAGELPTTQVGGARELGGIAGRQQATGSAARTFHAYLRSSSSEASAGASSAIVQCVACAPGFVRGRGGGRSYVRFSQALVCGSRGGGARRPSSMAVVSHRGQCSQLCRGKCLRPEKGVQSQGSATWAGYVRPWRSTEPGGGAARGSWDHQRRRRPSQLLLLLVGTLSAGIAMRGRRGSARPPWVYAGALASAADVLGKASLGGRREVSARRAVRDRHCCGPVSTTATYTCWPRSVRAPAAAIAIAAGRAHPRWR